MSAPHRFPSLRRFGGERAHAGQIADRLSQQEELIDSLEPSIHRLLDPAGYLAPAQDLLNAFALSLTNGVARPVRRAPVNDRYSTCSSNARISFSGAMPGRPRFASLSYIRGKTASMRSGASFNHSWIDRNG